MEFTFDRNPESEFNAGLIYQYLSSQREWKEDVLSVDKISFASRKEVGIQAADLWAREVMKRLECELAGREPRRSFVALRSTHLFFANFLMEGFYKSLRQRIDSLVETEGNRPKAYREWLGKRADNQSNRIFYLMSVLSKLGFERRS